MTTTPLALILPVLTIYFLAPSEYYGQLWSYIMAGNSNHAPTPLLFIPMQSNFHNLVAVLMGVIHPLDGNLLLRTVVYLGYANDNSD